MENQEECYHEFEFDCVLESRTERVEVYRCRRCGKISNKRFIFNQETPKLQEFL